MVAVLFVLPILSNLLPSNWHADVVRWLPSSAGDAITGTVSGAHPHMFSPWGQFAVLAVYTVIVLIAGVALFRKRDA
jgi:ABC-type transport system involved in multi-copper enzyme maturation permease subunit